MYIIYLDGKPIHSPGSKNQMVINPILDDGINKIGNLTFDIAVNNPYYNDIVEMKSKVKVLSSNKEIWHGRVLKESQDWHNTKSITCEGELGYFLDSPQRPYDEDLTDRQYIEFLVAEHNRQVDPSRRFVVGTVNVVMETEETDRENTDYKKTKDIFDELATKYGGHFVTRRTGGVPYLDYIKEYTNVAPQPIVFGKNLLDLKRDSRVSETATAIIPLGAQIGNERLTIEDVNDGKDYIYDEEAVAQYGYIYEVVTFDDIDDDEELIVEAQKKLDEMMGKKLVVEATAVDLAITSAQIESFAVGDKVRCISPPHNFDEQLQAHNIRIDMTNPDKSEIVLGAELPTMSGRTTAIENQVRAIAAEVGSLKQVDVPIIEDAPARSKQLWSGSWSSGTLTVPGISQYSLLVLYSTVPILCSRTSGSGFLIGVSAYTSGGIQYIRHIHASLSGDTLSIYSNNNTPGGGQTHIVSGAHGAAFETPVTAIYGITTKGMKGDKGDRGDPGAGNDFIVDYGLINLPITGFTTGTWSARYRKWNSGHLEIYGSFSLSASFTFTNAITAPIYALSGSYYWVDVNTSSICTAIHSASPIKWSGGWGGMIPYTTGAGTGILRMYPYHFTSATINPLNFSVEIKGAWK